MLKKLTLTIGLGMIILITSCDKNGDFLIFSIQDDILLGEQVAAEIANDPSFNLLSRGTYSAPYAYIDGMMESILNSGAITYREEFEWNVTLIDDDQILNAFATPGGQLYVYTGLIYFLDKPDDLAGVIAHEIAHADQRHSSKQLQRQYGISVLLSILAGGDPGTLQQIVAQLAGTGAILAFSRDAEAEADDFSVEYLTQTNYACNSAASFFQKLIDFDQQGADPEFLSTHPSPSGRVADINTKAGELACDTSVDSSLQAGYDNFKAQLP